MAGNFAKKYTFARKLIKKKYAKCCICEKTEYNKLGQVQVKEYGS